MTIHVSLPEELEHMVHAQVDSGFYKSASEVIREALRDFFSARSAFGPEQIHWLRAEMGARLEAVQDGSAALTDVDTVFDRLEAGLS
ncbi:MAG: type II toxin-antitoxin system ParD family antitoxin [Vampirovibrionales bacterium]|nr:type II toxin-antitoxin system ParD family antitoxin [Vampirovibrionales bacterium]